MGEQIPQVTHYIDPTVLSPATLEVVSYFSKMRASQVAETTSKHYEVSGDNSGATIWRPDDHDPENWLVMMSPHGHGNSPHLFLRAMMAAAVYGDGRGVIVLPNNTFGEDNYKLTWRHRVELARDHRLSHIADKAKKVISLCTKGARHVDILGDSQAGSMAPLVTDDTYGTDLVHVRDVPDAVPGRSARGLYKAMQSEKPENRGRAVRDADMPLLDDLMDSGSSRRHGLGIITNPENLALIFGLSGGANAQNVIKNIDGRRTDVAFTRSEGSMIQPAAYGRALVAEVGLSIPNTWSFILGGNYGHAAAYNLRGSTESVFKAVEASSERRAS